MAKDQTLQKQYIDFNQVNLEGKEIKLVIKEGTQTVETLRKREAVTKTFWTILTYILVVFLALIMILPFYWMIITSLKTNIEVENGNTDFFPQIVMWSNYVHVFEVFDFGTYMWNTIIVAIFSTIGMIITTILAAFAFARLKFKGRDALFSIFLMTMMIPGEMMVISNYVTVNSFGWLGNGADNPQTVTEAYLAMVVPFLVSVYYIYLLRQNFKQIPNELYLAAKVDGKSDFSFLLKVMVPLAAPTLISITILKFMGTWNAYAWPNLVTGGNEKAQLISIGLRGGSFTDPETERKFIAYQIAATVVVTVPLFLLFIFFRKYIMRGVGRAGIKG